MTDIPDDIRKRAAAALAQFPDSRVKTDLGVIIARALRTERLATEARVREECAKIAESMYPGGDWLDRDHAARTIAAAIREGRK